MVGEKRNIAMIIAKTATIAIFTAVFIIPLWLVVMASITDATVFNQVGYSFIAKAYSIKAYISIFQDKLIMRGLLNSAWATLSVTALSVIVNTSAAYVLHEKNMPGHKILNTLFVFTMFFNTGMIPIVLVIMKLGLYDTPGVLVVPAVINVYNILLIRNYFYSVPASLKEAPLIDGANQLQIFTNIMVPVSTPIIATTALMAFVTKWNSYMDVLYYVDASHKSLFTIQFVVQQMLADYSALGGEASSKVVMQSATIVITIFPLMLLFPLLQKYFVDGMTIGAVKG